MYTCMNKFNFSYTCTSTILLFFEDGNRYRAENFSVYLTSNGLSKNISHFVVV